MSRLLHFGATGKILYAIAWEKIDPKTRKVTPQIDYCHAKNRGDAWAQFHGSMQAQQCTKVVDIAPVIGYHVHDNHGEKLTV